MTCTFEVDTEKAEIVTWQERMLLDGAYETSEDTELLPECDFMRWLKRTTENEKLFLYRHRVHETFVLCVWIGEPHDRLCTELKSFFKHPQHIRWNKWSRKELLDMFRPHEEKMREKALLRAEREAHTQQLKAADREKKEGVVRHLKRRGKEDLAATVASHPYKSTTEDAEDFLKSRASDRIWSLPGRTPGESNPRTRS